MYHSAAWTQSKSATLTLDTSSLNNNNNNNSNQQYPMDSMLALSPIEDVTECGKKRVLGSPGDCDSRASTPTTVPRASSMAAKEELDFDFGEDSHGPLSSNNGKKGRVVATSTVSTVHGHHHPHHQQQQQQQSQHNSVARNIMSGISATPFSSSSSCSTTATDYNNNNININNHHQQPITANNNNNLVSITSTSVTINNNNIINVGTPSPSSSSSSSLPPGLDQSSFQVLMQMSSTISNVRSWVRPGEVMGDLPALDCDLIFSTTLSTTPPLSASSQASTVGFLTPREGKGARKHHTKASLTMCMSSSSPATTNTVAPNVTIAGAASTMAAAVAVASSTTSLACTTSATATATAAHPSHKSRAAKSAATSRVVPSARCGRCALKKKKCTRTTGGVCVACQKWASKAQNEDEMQRRLQSCTIPLVYNQRGSQGKSQQQQQQQVVVATTANNGIAVAATVLKAK